ncbi:MAG: DNA alkylation repair protein [Anaerolineales bacterium]|nr:DNA alkylation repair protein [Anaerolineales bacterium]MCW5854485.1 DNA alkylation repair protein [Anaerolineales bacterium]
MTRALDAILAELKQHGSQTDRAGMARFGIATERAFGVKHPLLKQIARRHRKDHPLALELWDSGYHEARLLATLVADPAQVSEVQLEAWLADINSWDLCDGFTGNLVDKTPFAYAKAVEWARRAAEFERRAGFALMAWLAVHDKQAPNEKFAPFFDLIQQQAADERNYVKKAVNWALRQLGKRNRALNAQAIAVAQRIAQQGSKSARWIAADALRELQSEAVAARLAAKEL